MLLSYLQKVIASKNDFCKEVFCNNFGRGGMFLGFLLSPDFGDLNSMRDRLLSSSGLSLTGGPEAMHFISHDACSSSSSK